MRIAIVVPGRFYGFDRARALIENGEDVTVYTNYPKCIVRKWGIQKKNVKSFLFHGILSRLFNMLQLRQKSAIEHFLSTLFAKWAKNKILQEKYDIVTVFSGVAEEIFRAIKDDSTLKILNRGSSHIITQHVLLNEESIRAKKSLELPCEWIIEREKREYELADNIQVLSTFALNSFLENKVPKEKMYILPLGIDTSLFRPKETIIKERVNRIIAGKRLNVLMVGSFSFRKGIFDLENIISSLSEDFNFTFVGDVPNEGKGIAKKLKGKIEMIPRQPEFELAKYYNEADIFIFPTIEDGFAAVLTQALAAGLPVICTTNCGGPDIIREGETGWILPIRSPRLFIEQLKWCDKNREELSNIARSSYESNSKDRTWNDIAIDFIGICGNLFEKRKLL